LADPHSEEVEMNDHAQAMTLSGRADELEEHMMHELEHIVIKSALFDLADGKLTDDTASTLARNPGKYLLMKEDPRLPKMPAKPTLIDYFKCRFASTSHLLQSAAHAKKAGQSEKVIMACLLHDIAVASFIRCDHGYWGAQMIEPYVDEEVSWAVRAHQALRFFPDQSVGYQYPEAYVKWFGPDFQPNHKHYMTARFITLHDLYSFDPNAKIDVEEFSDILGRHFKQPKEGLGLDSGPSAHMWRTMLWPTRFL
jgi:HD domain